MRLVVADTGPLNYLVQIGQAAVLPKLFEKVAIPLAVRDELSDPRAPAAVRDWISAPPAWLEIHAIAVLAQTAGLDEGEAAAISLAISIDADILLIDERPGSRIAQENGLRVTGTLGILDLAAERGLILFPDAVNQLMRTNFRRPPALLNALIDKHLRRMR